MTIFQFGTSRFLQAHVDLFAHEARVAGQDVPPITIVQTSGSPDRADRVRAFNDPAGYPVRIRGLVDGTPVDRTVQVRSVVRGLSTARDWAEIVRTFAHDTRYILTNTGDSGYRLNADDFDSVLFARRDAPPSFPAKLALLLWHRWQAGMSAPTILPCELIQQNGVALRDVVLQVTDAAAPDSGFRDWLGQSVVWCDTLVDRIVSEPLDPIGAVAEPYALWAIARQPRLVMPFSHPAVVVVDDLEPYERLKLHILNLGHTILAQWWINAGEVPGCTVRAMLGDPVIAAELESILRDDVLPIFAAHGLAEPAQAYIATTLERFRNPYLDHLLADIAQNQVTKLDRRLGTLRAWKAWASTRADRLDPVKSDRINTRLRSPQLG